MKNGRQAGVRTQPRILTCEPRASPLGALGGPALQSAVQARSMSPICETTHGAVREQETGSNLLDACMDFLSKAKRFINNRRDTSNLRATDLRGQRYVAGVLGLYCWGHACMLPWKRTIWRPGRPSVPAAGTAGAAGAEAGRSAPPSPVLRVLIPIALGVIFCT